MTKSIKISNIHLFDDKLTIKKYKNPNKIIRDFFDIRLQKYVERKAYMLKLLRDDLELKENKMKWLQFIVSGKIQLQKMKTDEIINFLSNNKIMRRNNTYDYLLNMSIRDMTKENIDRLKTKIDKIKIDIKDLTSKTPETLWKIDLLELKATIN